MGSLIGLTLVVVVGVNWRFRAYGQTPELARQFASAQSRRWSLIFFWRMMVAFLVVTWLFLGPWKRHL
jgi:hypothetical protein